MKLSIPVLMWFGFLVAGALVACDVAQPSMAANGETKKGDVHVDAKLDENKEAGVNGLLPPTPDSILYMIYQFDGDGASNYKIPGGATVAYWYGYAFNFKGKDYFVGFASKTNDEGGDLHADLEYEMEDGRVSVSQATFVKNEKGDAWLSPDIDGYIGEFGRDDKAVTVDRSRHAVSHETADGRFILAVPSSVPVEGEDVPGYEVFLFDPGNVDNLKKFRSWGYLGSIKAGEDGASSCEGQQGRQCRHAAVHFSFDKEMDAGLPRLRITFAGVGSSPAQQEERVIVYRFDEASNQYRR